MGNLTQKTMQKRLSMYHVLLYMSLQDDSIKNVPEIYNVVGNDIFKLVKLYGGQTIKIPTLDELKNSFREFEIIFDKITNNMSWLQTSKKYQLTKADILPIKNKCRVMSKNILKMLKE
jgi:Mor family transcriptional regulator